MATYTTEKAISILTSGSPDTTQPRPRSRQRRLQKITTFTTYATLVALVASIVSVGYQSPIEQQVASQTSGPNTMQLDNPSVDQLQAAQLAADTAQVANLSVASNVSNLSISLGAKSQLSQVSDTVLSKPQIVQSGSGQRGVIEYTSVEGDTAQTIAARFGLSAQTVKWANGMVNDSVTTGTKLQIPSMDGVVYTVKSGDTIEAIASKYGTPRERILTYNDLETTGITPGAKIIVPDGILPTNERPEAQRQTSTIAATPRSTNPVGSSYYASAAAVGNRYDYGYCTWYAYNRRAEIGRPVGSFWGNASSWAYMARAAGFRVDNTPEFGAVMQDSYSAGGYGHVAVVEEVRGDGSIMVSEMNYAGWNVKSTRTLDAGQAARYNYIH